MPGNGFALLVMIFCLMTVGSVQAEGRVDPAYKLIQSMAEQAKSRLSNDTLPIDRRESLFRQDIRPAFDFDFISAFVVGPKWDRLEPRQKEEFTDLFSEFFLQSYSFQFGGYPEDRFEILEVKANGDGDLFVLTQLFRPNRKRVVSRWRLRESADGLRIVDVEISGTSVITAHRKSFHNQLVRGSVEGLLNILRMRAERLSPQSTGSGEG
ncbi:MlaC/ttg2D family ABC transporter substrate-binding protein [Sneathiella chinensis]|uniref:Toluene tolerance protein n=1 Tax=Sneathiella chinensis TaxID=349750 RepID=A0ABQ5U6I0_9PROT|nr:ABC transporter substrate-binding protein [Sneathiella chinensis]GLQ07288.1 hypothetical protein GCM10007924_25090 [Sneathiella chinensis]